MKRLFQLLRWPGLLLVLAVCRHQIPAQSILTADGLAAYAVVPAGGGGGGCVSAYRTNDVFFSGSQNGIGTGDRIEPTIGVITATVIISGTPQSGSWMADNNFANGQFFFGGDAAANYVLQIDFGSGKSFVLTEITWFQQTSDAHGTWQVEGSNDGSAWTALGSTFTLGGAATQVITTLSGNTTAYRYYHLKGISGTTSSNPYIYEVWLKNCQ